MAVTFCFSINFSPINKSYAKDLGETKVIEDVNKDKGNKNNEDIYEDIYQTNTIKFTATTSTGKALDSGVWIIKDKKNNIIDTFNVSKNSYIFTKTLPKGEYLFEQKIAPKGYFKDNNVVTIKIPILSKKKIDTFEISPKITKEIPKKSTETPKQSSEIYKTGSIDPIYFLLAIIFIFPIVFLVVNSNKKKVGEK